MKKPAHPFFPVIFTASDVDASSSYGGRLMEANGQDRPSAPAEDTRGIVSIMVIATGIVLFTAFMAYLLQTLILPPVAVPGIPNTSTPSNPATTVSNISEILSAPGHQEKAGNNTMKATVHGPSDTLFRTAAGISAEAITGYSREMPVINATSLEARIHTLVNKIRRENGLQPLATDLALVSLARAHSSDMASKGYFGHVNLDERDATARGAAAGYTCHKAADPYYTYAIAENLYATYRYTAVFLNDSLATGYAWTTEEAMAEETVNAWMTSPDHRDNILDTGMGREGIGVAFGQGDMVFVTQDFC